jgi:hypothetical protein
MDTESYMYPPRCVTEVGIAVFDLLDFSKDGNFKLLTDSNILRNITSHHFRVREQHSRERRNKGHGKDFALGDNFEFGVSEFVKVEDITRALLEIMIRKDRNGKTRKVLIINQGGNQDWEHLTNEFSFSFEGFESRSFELRELFKRSHTAYGTSVSLENIANDLELRAGITFHNAGNDAVMQLYCALLIAKNEIITYQIEKDNQLTENYRIRAEEEEKRAAENKFRRSPRIAKNNKKFKILPEPEETEEEKAAQKRADIAKELAQKLYKESKELQNSDPFQISHRAQNLTEYVGDWASRLAQPTQHQPLYGVLVHCWRCDGVNHSDGSCPEKGSLACSNCFQIKDHASSCCIHRDTILDDGYNSDTEYQNARSLLTRVKERNKKSYDWFVSSIQRHAGAQRGRWGNQQSTVPQNGIGRNKAPATGTTGGTLPGTHAGRGRGRGEPIPAGRGRGDPVPAGRGRDDPVPARRGQGSPVPAGRGKGGPIPARWGDGGPISSVTGTGIFPALPRRAGNRGGRGRGE